MLYPLRFLVLGTKGKPKVPFIDAEFSDHLVSFKLAKRHVFQYCRMQRRGYKTNQLAENRRHMAIS